MDCEAVRWTEGGWDGGGTRPEGTRARCETVDEGLDQGFEWAHEHCNPCSAVLGGGSQPEGRVVERGLEHRAPSTEARSVLERWTGDSR